MTVENVNYISDLEPDRPRGGDKISLGDDHIRNIKKSLKQTFPNVDGEVKPTDEEMNFLVGVMQPIQPILDQGSADFTALDGRVTKNESDIADHESRITNNEADIADHESRITKNESDIAQIDADLSAGSGDIAALQSQVNTNTQNISNNASAIASQGSAISANTNYIKDVEVIAVNNEREINSLDASKADKTYVDAELAKKASSADLAALEGKVNSNTSDIQENKGDIADLQVAVDKLAGGAMVKIIQQPITAGNFSHIYDFEDEEFMQIYSASITRTAQYAHLNLIVPQGAEFCLQGIRARTDGKVWVEINSVLIDSVPISTAGANEFWEWNAGDKWVWPGKSYAPIKAAQEIKVSCIRPANSGGTFGNLDLVGFFVEA